jgi:hypothetical protein
MMTPLMESVLARVEQLPASEQDALAQRILDELADEQWDKAFTDSTDKLAALADEALAEHRAGKTRLLEPEQL